MSGRRAPLRPDGVQALQSGGSLRPAASGASNFSCLVAARCGGVGKTLFAKILEEALRRSGIAPQMAAVDTEAGGFSFSKLGHQRTDVTELTIAPNFSDVTSGHGENLLDHWDRLAPILRHRNVIVDFGANVIGSFLGWAQAAQPIRLPEILPVNIAIPLTMSEQSAADTLTLLGRIIEAQQDIRIGRIVVVMNEVHGAVRRPGPYMRILNIVVRSRGIPVMRLRQGLLQPLEEGISLSELSTIDLDTYCRRLCAGDVVRAAAELHAMKKWVETSIATIRFVGLAPGSGTF